METFHAQIVVCGAGTAGLPAALAAARHGCTVAVIEEDARIGGAPTDFYINNYCGDPIQGIYAELRERMKKYAPGENLNPNCFRLTSYLMAWDELFEGLPVTFYTGHRIEKAEVKDGRIIAVESSSARFEGEVFIDATGDAALAVLTPCEWRYGREAQSEYNEKFAPEKADSKVQLCTLMYTVRPKPGCEDAKPANWALFNKQDYLIWGPTVGCEDTADPVKLCEAQNRAMAMLRSHAEKWDQKGYYITNVAPKLGVRESRRIVGDYVLNYNDIMGERSYDDAVCVVRYNIDPWDPEGNPVHSSNTVKSTMTPHYEIPYRCLTTPNVENMLVTGRCVSATHVANSSLRVMAITHILGQAAGNAAWIALRDSVSVRNIDVTALREDMKAQNVWVSLAQYRKDTGEL